MQSHPWLYRPAADGKQLYWDDCLAKITVHIWFLLNVYEVWNEQYIYFFFVWHFFLESWNGNWLQAPPLQEHFDLVKFWARSKLFHIEKGNDLAFRMLIHNQSNASCCCKPFKIRECAWFLVPAPFCRAVCIPCLSFFHDSDLKCFCFQTHLSIKHEAYWSISCFIQSVCFCWHVQPQPLWAGQKPTSRLSIMASMKSLTGRSRSQRTGTSFKEGSHFQLVGGARLLVSYDIIPPWVPIWWPGSKETTAEKHVWKVVEGAHVNEFWFGERRK